MNTASKLGAYALGLAAVFGGAVGVGDIAGPAVATVQAEKAHGGGHGTADTKEPVVPGGLQVSQGGYTLVPEATVVEPGEETDFRFTVNGPDGKPVTRYQPLHGKELHLIVARRDLSGFQHLHPTQAGGGVWTIPLTLPDAGTYRFFTDVQPEGAKEQLTLGTDVTAPGDFRPLALPKSEPVATVDGYEVELNGTLTPGTTSKLVLTVRKDGKPVTDLEPYLEAYGHLVALRDRDLAYLHVHPDGEPGDGKTRPGPEITFYAEVPSSGAYRLYLDFQHDGEVRTAEFTARAGDADRPAERPAETDDGHGDHEHG
ncbi:hypothetical protein BJF79_19635 [Actinomadura sp. CNU-125]|uniref:hypothetical protein n=1 Tax=Actinomadura sp. CNU-125 TaxID=1904961 RepID=UPI00095ADC9B|nr:hypothetical protein [Actinomadura sp. CNU-125]OLT13896.1 hypothetical protein BJF79_19635 [Actinomadura sp. CNU-125]